MFNVKNEHWWAPKDANPRRFQESNPQHRFSLNVWVGIIGNYIIVPHYFDGNNNGFRIVVLGITQENFSIVTSR